MKNPTKSTKRKSATETKRLDVLNAERKIVERAMRAQKALIRAGRQYRLVVSRADVTMFELTKWLLERDAQRNRREEQPAALAD